MFVISYPDLTAFLTAKKITVTGQRFDAHDRREGPFNGAVLDVHGTYDVGTLCQDLVFSPARGIAALNGAASRRRRCRQWSRR